MAHLVLLTGGCGESDALFRSVLASRLRPCPRARLELGSPLDEQVGAAVLALAVSPCDALASAEQLPYRAGRASLYGIVARGVLDRDAVVRAAIACLAVWSEGASL
jgi:hypothetical protein